MTEPLLARITRMTFSHVKRKVPSTPHTSIAEVSMRVRRNGIFSGNLSRCMATSKQSPKSMCTILPENLCSMRFEGWRSPSPSTYPTMDISASERV